MDLVAGVRKEGSRGGRGEFKWSDVESSSHRENYLGHSLMAPVGRWQKGRDLSWYAKAGEDDAEEQAARELSEREQEIKRIKEAEQDALARALGLPVAPKNANTEPLGSSKEVEKALKEAVDDEDQDAAKGVGFGAYAGRLGADADGSEEVLEGTTPSRRGPVQRKEDSDRRRTQERRRHRSRDKHRHRSRSRSRDRDRRHKRDYDRDYYHKSERRHEDRRRSRSRHRRPRSRSQSASRDRRKSDRYENDRRRDRSHSPDRHRHLDRDSRREYDSSRRR